MKTTGCRIALAGLLACLAPAAMAETLYDCSFDRISRHVWVSPRIVVLWTEGEKTATVNDALVLTFAGHPIEAKVVRASKKRVAFKWTLEVVDASNTHARLFTTVSIDRLTGAAQVTGDLLSYSNRYGASGRCMIGDADTILKK